MRTDNRLLTFTVVSDRMAAECLVLILQDAAKRYAADMVIAPDADLPAIEYAYHSCMTFSTIFKQGLEQ